MAETRMDFIQDFRLAQEAISAALVNTTRAVAQVAAEDIAFHRSSDPAIGSSLDQQNMRLLTLAEKLLRLSAVAPDAEYPSLPNVEAVDTSWTWIEDALDNLLERADTSLDEFTGLVKKHSPLRQPESLAPKLRSNRSAHQFRAQNVPKPQLLFETKPANYALPPFRPFLVAKPHAITPLEKSFEIPLNEWGAPQYQHPYQLEIDRYHYPESVYTKSDPIPYGPLRTTKATYVEDFEGVLSMLEELRNVTEIAIDLEHHDIHSYIGMVSLMQISTRDHDWIVDTLKPWRRKLAILNELFANPNILKVLHGAHMDVVWLQRDLGLYIVGLFDTHHASRVLGYAGGSLAFLLKKFVDFDAQKQYQTADWRMRPLPPEMFDYARSDTHFLLYVYDHMRNDLINVSVFDNPEQDCIRAVLKKSKETALQRYEHPTYDEKYGFGRNGWLMLLPKIPSMTGRQIAIFKQVHQWRDKIARHEDESTFYVMPNHLVSNIARAMPDDTASLLGVLHPISQPVRDRIEELLDVIRNVEAEVLAEPGTADLITNPSQSIDKSTSSSGGTQSRFKVRTAASTFWGSTLEISSTADSDSGFLRVNLEHAAISLPRCTMGPFVASNKNALIDQPNVIEFDQETPPNITRSFNQMNGHPHSPQRMGKRKVGDNADTNSAEGRDDNVALQERTALQSHEEPQEETLQKVQRLQKQAERKAAKRMHKIERTVASLTTGSTDDSNQQNRAVSRPFDYNAAPPVFHAAMRKSDRKDSKLPVNPYAKAADAPSGMHRSQTPKAGKTFTFPR